MIVGVIFAILPFLLIFVGYVKPNLFPSSLASEPKAIQLVLDQIRDTLILRFSEAMSGDVHALRLALAPPLEPPVITLWGTIFELPNELQLLTVAVREVREECRGVQTEVRALAPIFLEILSEPRRPEMEILRIQGDQHRLPYANQLGIGPAQALVRQRIQALFPLSPLRAVD